jgi:cobaltochelatase CobS
MSAAPVSADAALDALRRALGTPAVDVEALQERVLAAVDRRIAELTVPQSLLVQPRGDAPPVKIANVHRKFRKILALVNRGRNVLLVGPKGSGKSTIASQLAQAMDRPVLVFTCSVGTTKADILGYMAADGYHESPFHVAWRRGYVILMDEFDTLHPQVSPVLNDGFSRRFIQFPTGELDSEGNLVPTPFGDGGVIVAAANTVGKGADKQYVGRSRIDDASTDRFELVEIEYDEKVEDAIVAGLDAPARVKANAKSVCRELRKAARELNIAVDFGVRAMTGICEMAMAGFDQDEIVYGRLSRGMATADWQTLTRSVRIPSLTA